MSLLLPDSSIDGSIEARERFVAVLCAVGGASALALSELCALCALAGVVVVVEVVVEAVVRDSAAVRLGKEAAAISLYRDAPAPRDSPAPRLVTVASVGASLPGVSTMLLLNLPWFPVETDARRLILALLLALRLPPALEPELPRVRFLLSFSVGLVR